MRTCSGSSTRNSSDCWRRHRPCTLGPDGTVVVRSRRASEARETRPVKDDVSGSIQSTCSARHVVAFMTAQQASALLREKFVVRTPPLRWQSHLAARSRASPHRRFGPAHDGGMPGGWCTHEPAPRRTRPWTTEPRSFRTDAARQWRAQKDRLRARKRPEQRSCLTTKSRSCR